MFWVQFFKAEVFPMLIITTVYIAEAKVPAEHEVQEGRQIRVADLKESTREWLSIYEGKNRVFPIDRNN
jgi:hypothetical protein